MLRMSRINSLIFRSQIDPFSYLPQFHFMNSIPICEYCNLTNYIPIHEYLILIRNIYREWAYISLWPTLPGKFFKEKIYESQEKEITTII